MPGILLTYYVDPSVYYEAGFSGSVTIPSDISRVDIWLQAAGGAGAERATVEGSGGGGGGFAYLTRTVQSGEWGTTLTLSVGAGAVDADGGATTLSGTLDGASVSVTANGGNKGSASADGTGGTATGGDTNVSGYDGSGFVASPPDERAPGFGGAGGGDGVNGTLYSGTPDGMGSGSRGALISEGLPGNPGYAKFLWS